MAGTIVVGVDGSPASTEALRWAAEEARLRQARVVVLHVWTFIPPTPVGDPGMMAIPSGNLAEQLELEKNAAQASLDSVVAEALGRDPGVDVEAQLVEGDAGEALLAASEQADLLVVGSHGKTGWRAALLGSVSRHVVSHAPGTVVVVKQKPEGS